MHKTPFASRFRGLLIDHAYLPLRFGRCVKVEPAAVFDALLVLPLRSVLEAADAARPEVTLAGAIRWANAKPAADFAALLVDLLLKTFEAALAARLLVCSLFLAICSYLSIVCKLFPDVNRRCVAEHEKCENDEYGRDQ